MTMTLIGSLRPRNGACVNSALAMGREKIKKKPTKQKSGKAWVNDEEHLLIIQLGKHLQPSAIAKLLGRSFFTIKSHLKDWELPSIKAQRRNKGGRTTDILAGEPKAIIEAKLKQSNWTITGAELHELLVLKFPHPKKKHSEPFSVTLKLFGCGKDQRNKFTPS